MFRFALKNLLSRPVRTLLALCGLTVAIAGMVGLFSVAEGIEESVSATFARVPGLTVMQPGAPIPLFSKLPAAWGDEISGVKGIRSVHPEVWVRAQLVEGKATFSPPRFLFGSDLKTHAQLKYSVYHEGLQEGRFLTADDVGTSNTVISRAIADEFHKHVGDSLRVDRQEMTIVGIYHCQSLFLDVAIILDIDLVRKMGRIGSDSVSNFYVEPEPEADRERIIGDLKSLFRGRAPEAWQPSALSALGMGPEATSPNPVGSLLSTLGQVLSAGAENKSKSDDGREKGDNPPPEKSASRSEDSAVRDSSAAQNRSPASEKSEREELPIEVRNADDWADEFKRFTADLDILLVVMTSIGVVIAFVGIVNTMLMSVTERFIEFGILKANGWSSGQILRLIAMESAWLGLVGGIGGCGLGWVITQFVNARWPTRIHLYASPQLLLFSLAFSTVLGIAGGLYPALRASRMMPMDAIRRG